MPGLSAAATNAMLDNVFNNGGGDVRIRLHTGQPGAAGTTNTTSAVTTQQPAPFGAADTTATNTAPVVWAGSEVTGTVTVTHWSAWLGGSATPGTGSFVASGPLGASYALTAGTAFRIKTGTFVASMHTATDAATATWPNLTNTGVPAGWTPTTTITDQDINSSSVSTGSPPVIENYLFSGTSIFVNQNNLTIRNCKFTRGGIVSGCETRTTVTLVEDCSFLRDTWVPNASSPFLGGAAVGDAGYTARRVQIVDYCEGFRCGGSTVATNIEDCWVRVKSPATGWGSPPDYGIWHGDCLQGFGASGICNVTHCYMELTEDPPEAGGTGVVFWPDQGNSAKLTVDGLISNGWVRLGSPNGIEIQGMRIIDDSWPTTGTQSHQFDNDLTCAQITWGTITPNQIITVDSNYQPVSVVQTLLCNSPVT